jgi:DNA-binding PadR family transcriptional regulator
MFHKGKHGRRHRCGPQNWGPWDAGGRFFGQGEIRLALLALLAEKPMHGYEMMRLLEERLNGSYKASAGAIYPTLPQLEDEGLITSKKEESKKVCRLTGAGEEQVAQDKQAIDELCVRAEEWGEWGIGNYPAMSVLAKPTMMLMKSIKKQIRRGNDVATIHAIEQALVQAREEVDQIGKA